MSLGSLITLARVPVSARRLLLVVLAGSVLLALAGAAPAFAEAPWWRISSEVLPTNLPPAGEGEVLIVTSNLGDGAINGATSPVLIADKLPAGLTATAISGEFRDGVQTECVLASLTCTYAGLLNPYEQLTITIKVKVGETSGTLADEASVEGGRAPKVTSTQHVTVSGEPTPFGVQGFELTPTNEDGTPATQAGSHPFQLTTSFVMNQTAARQPVALPKDLRFNLPPGFVGNPNAAAQCTMANFSALVDETNLCSPSSVVGVATVTVHEPIVGILPKTVPVFNLVPAQGEPARFGFEVLGKVPIVIDASVRSGRDYGVVAGVDNATQVAGLLSSEVTFWGVPGDPRHNQSRGWECVAGGVFRNQVGRPCPTSSEVPQQPFLTLPTSCAASPPEEPVISSTEVDSWAQPGSFLSAGYSWLSDSGQPLGFEGCSMLPFAPEIQVEPEQHSASTPVGVTVDVKVPQTSTLEAGGLAEADVRDTTVALPAGVQLSPSAANGLQACSEQQIGFTGFNQQSQTDEFTPVAPSCPDASKVGLVHIKTPLLSHELEGAVYLASPAPNGEGDRNPFGSLVALYVVAQDPVSGVLVKLAGEGQISEGSLRVSTTFRNTPQVPFEDLRIDLFGGPRASVSTPPACGSYPTDAAFRSWSGTGTVNLSSPGELFEVTSGVGGSGCPSAPGFAPGFLAQSANPQAGAFTSFALELSRPDGDQALSAVTVHLPPGIAAVLSSVALCSEAQAAASACPPASEVGHATAVSGLGPEPFVQGAGRVFITGPYGGAPFGLEIVTPAVAGPFDLGTVTVRSKLFIDPSTAAVTIVSDPLPTQLKGIPLQLKRVIVTVDRPGFEFNPTDCDPMSIHATVTGAEGASANVSSPFQVANCGALPFKPVLTASAGGRASKAGGTSFVVKVATAGLGQANIAKVDLQLPKALPARLSTIQKACVAAVFEANPAGCGEGSLIGTATIHTPVLRSPLSGPAYLVSHGGAAFPDVEFVLQGEGVTVILDGKTDIKKGVTYSRFESAPDAPFTSFETVLPAGPHSALTADVPEKQAFDLCGSKLSAPTEITAQDGALIKQNTPIALTGCGGVKGVKARKLTRAQKLAKALKACRKKHSHSRRAACERQAHTQYGPKKPAHKHARRGTPTTQRAS